MQFASSSRHRGLHAADAVDRIRQSARSDRVDRLNDDPEGRREWALIVAGVLAALPIQQADAVRLPYFDQLTEREVAAHMGVALGQAQTIAASGLRSLGEALHEPSDVT